MHLRLPEDILDVLIKTWVKSSKSLPPLKGFGRYVTSSKSLPTPFAPAWNIRISRFNTIINGWCYRDHLESKESLGTHLTLLTKITPSTQPEWNFHRNPPHAQARIFPFQKSQLKKLTPSNCHGLTQSLKCTTNQENHLSAHQMFKVHLFKSCGFLNYTHTAKTSWWFQPS